MFTVIIVLCKIGKLNKLKIINKKVNEFTKQLVGYLINNHQLNKNTRYFEVNKM